MRKTCNFATAYELEGNPSRQDTRQLSTKSYGQLNREDKGIE